MLCCAVDKAREGKHQFLSGTLHNVAKALAHSQPQPDLQTALLAAGYGSSKPLIALQMPVVPSHCRGAPQPDMQAALLAASYGSSKPI